MLSLLLDDGLDDNRMVDGTGSHTLDALERSADIYDYTHRHLRNDMCTTAVPYIDRY